MCDKFCDNSGHGPMDNPELYKISSSWQETDVKEALEEFSHLFKWRPDGGDTVIDVGSGTGNVLYKVLIPFLPENFGQVIGSDVSNEMINYARESYKDFSKLSFKHMDAAKDVETQAIFHDAPFDHLTSFYCLMFVQNQILAITNFYKLLRPGGDMFLVFLANHPAYDFYAQQAQDPRWGQYIRGVAEEISTPYQNSATPAEDLRKILVDVGFTDVNVVARNKTYTFNGMEKLRNTFTAVNSFVARMPQEFQSAYIDDLMERLAQVSALDDYQTHPETCRFAPQYGLMIAYARK